jgi:hypothetical protein
LYHKGIDVGNLIYSPESTTRVRPVSEMSQIVVGNYGILQSTEKINTPEEWLPDWILKDAQKK